MPRTGMPRSSSRGSRAGRARRVHRGGAARQHQPGGLERQDLLGRRVVRDHRREHAALADAARDELAVLRPEVHHQDPAGDGGGERRVEGRRLGGRRQGCEDSEEAADGCSAVAGWRGQWTVTPRLLAVAVALGQRHLAGLEGCPEPLPASASRRRSSDRGSPWTRRTSARAPAGRIQSSSSPRSACADRPPTVATWARTVTSRPMTRTPVGAVDQLAAEPAVRLEADDQHGGGAGRRARRPGGGGCARRTASPSRR